MHPSAPHTHAAVVILAACLAVVSPTPAVAQDKVEAAERRAAWQQVFNEALGQGAKLRRKNQAGQAAQVYLNALGKLPAHVDNQDFRQSLARQLGQTYEDMGSLDAAVNVYRQIPALQPLGTQVLKNAGQMDRAIAYAVSVGDLLGLGRIYESKGDDFSRLGSTGFLQAGEFYKQANEAYEKARADRNTVIALLGGIQLKYGEMARELYLAGIGSRDVAENAYTAAAKAYAKLEDERGKSLGIDGMVEAAHGLWLLSNGQPDPALAARYGQYLTIMGTDAIEQLGSLHRQMNRMLQQRAELARKHGELKVPEVTYPNDPDRARELQERLRARMTHVRDSQTRVTKDAQTQLLEGMSRECTRLGRASQLLGDLPRAAKAYVKAEQLLEKYIKTVDRARWTQLQNGEFRRRFAELKKKRVEVLNEAQLSPADVISPPNANAPDILDRLLSSPGE